MNAALSDFWYWLNSNISISSEDIITLKNPKFSNSLSCDSSMFSVVK